MAEVLCGTDGCAKPVADNAYCCTSCGFLLDDALSEVIGGHGLDGLAAELEVTLSKQDRIGDRGPGSSERPLPLNLGSSEVGWILRNTLHGWVRLVAEETHAGLPVNTLTDMARWLRPRVGWLRHHQAGPEAVAEIVASVSACRRNIDRPPSLWYAGPCGAATSTESDCSCCCHIGGAFPPACDVVGGCHAAHQTADCRAELYAHPGALNVICRDCGSVYNLADRRGWLLSQVEDQLMHSIAAAALVRHLGVQVADSSIRAWASRGRIVAHTRDVRNRPLYRIGDVLEVVLGPRHAKGA